MATAPKGSTHIPAWKGSSVSEPHAVNIKTDGLQQSDPERPKITPPAARVQTLPQVVSSASEEMAAHSTALNRLFRAAEDLEMAERDERDALAKAAVLTSVKQQCLRARDDAKLALAAAGRSCRIAAEAHHAELLRQLAASTASLAASLAATSDDGDIGATSLDGVASAASPSTATSAPTSTPATISATTSTTYSAKSSPAFLPLSGATPCPPPPPPSSPPTGTPTDPVSIVEANPTSPPSVAPTPPTEVVTRIEAIDVPFLNASIEDVRQANGLDRSATEDMSFAATRVLRFCSARESPAITIATVIDRAATNTSGGFACAVNNLVTALRHFHANTEHSWFSSSSPAAAPGVLAPSPSPRATSFSPSSSLHHSRAPVITAAVNSTDVRSPQRVRPSSTSSRSRRTTSCSSNVNSFSDNSTATSATYAHNHRRRFHDYCSHYGHTYLRRPADAAATTTSSSSGRPRDDDRLHLATANRDVSGSHHHMSDINSTTTTASNTPAPCARRDGSAGKARLLRDDSRDRARRGNTRHRLHRDDSRDRLRRETYTRDRPRRDNDGGAPCGDGNGDGPRPDDNREGSRRDNNRRQPHREASRDRSRANNNNNRLQRRDDNNRGQPLNGDFRGRPRDYSNRGHPRQKDDGGRPRAADNNKGQPRRDDSRDRPRGDNDDHRPRTNNDDRPRVNNDNRPRANNDDGSRANNDDRPRANNDDRPRANNDDRPRDNNNRDRPRSDSRDHHQQPGGDANGPDDRHSNLKTDDVGNCVGNRGRRGHRWGVKGVVPASGLTSGFASCFASGSASGLASTTPSNPKRPTSPSRPASTRLLQRPRYCVADYPSSSCDGFDVFVSPPTLVSNVAAVVASLDGAARSLGSSTTACVQRTATNNAAAAVLETSRVHAVEQANVGTGMR